MADTREQEDGSRRVDIEFRTPEEKARYARRVDAAGGTLRGYARVVLLRDVEEWEAAETARAARAQAPATAGAPA